MLTLTRPTASVKTTLDTMTTRLLRAIRVRPSTQLPAPPALIVVHSSNRARPGYGLRITAATMTRIDPVASATLQTPNTSASAQESTDGTDLRFPADSSCPGLGESIRAEQSGEMVLPQHGDDSAFGATMQGIPGTSGRRSTSGASHRGDNACGERSPFTLAARYDRPERSRPMPLSFDDSEPFATKYAPRHLAEFHGNDAAIAKLTRWASNPTECAILLSGATGTGKTTAASAFGRAIGVNLDDSFGRGGYHEIPPGLQTKEAIQDCLRELRFFPMGGDGRGWRIVVVNECDYAHDNVLNFWLGIIDSAEAIRARFPKTIFLFTSESADKLRKKRAAFVDRCRTVEFTSDPTDQNLSEGAQSYADAIFQAELGTDAPTLDAKAEGLLDDAGRLSMRRVASWCEAIIRDGRKPVTSAQAA
jgi:hypothetical protein